MDFYTSITSKFNRRNLELRINQRLRLIKTVGKNKLTERDVWTTDRAPRRETIWTIWFGLRINWYCESDPSVGRSTVYFHAATTAVAGRLTGGLELRAGVVRGVGVIGAIGGNSPSCSRCSHTYGSTTWWSSREEHMEIGLDVWRHCYCRAWQPFRIVSLRIYMCVCVCPHHHHHQIVCVSLSV